MCVGSPRESEWDADISHGSRDSPGLNAAVIKVDWAGGPSYGLRAAPPTRPATVRHYSLLPPVAAANRGGSVVTFDIGQPGVRRHSSPVMSSGGARRRSIVAAESSRLPSSGGSSTTALRSPFGPRRSADDFRPLQAHFRKRSSAEQSLTSFRIGSNDDDLVEEEEEELADFEEQRLDEDEDEDEGDDSKTDRDVTAGLPLSTGTELGVASWATTTSETSPAVTVSVAPDAEKKRSSLKRNHTDDSEVERRVDKLLYEINYSE